MRKPFHDPDCISVNCQIRLHEEGRMEAALRVALRDTIVESIEMQKLTPEQVGEKLGLLPTGGINLMNKKNSWTLSTCIRIAEAIELPELMHFFGGHEQ